MLDNNAARIRDIVLGQLQPILGSYDAEPEFDTEAERLEYVKKNCTTYKAAWNVFSGLKEEYTGGHLTHHTYFQLLTVMHIFESAADDLATRIIEGGLDDN